MKMHICLLTLREFITITKYAWEDGININTMKTISHPSSLKLCWALIPIAIISVLQLFIRIDTWVWLLVMTASIVLYLTLMTYFCIQQKCYKQLAINYLIGIVFLFTLYLQFVYVPKKVQNIERNQVEMKT